MALAAGTRVGAYQILSLLGSGGMGEVYLAEDTRLRRQVALKRLVGRGSDGPQSSERLLNEARAAGSLNHPNIATIHDVFEANGSAFIVMEYAPGETLAAVVRRGPVPVDRLLDISLQLADALVAAHGVGIFHRDLKPSNIHLTPAGTIKVLDFGVARITHDARKDTTDAGDERTRTATSDRLVGTPGYMAPEQLAGQPLDGRADIYSAGVVLFQLATGRPPFEATDPFDRVLSAIGQQPPRASDVHAGVPAPVSDVIARALATKPRDRYQSAEEFKAAVDVAAATIRHDGWDAPTGPVHVTPPPTPAPRSMHRLWVGGLVVLALATGGFLAKSMVRSSPPSAPAARPAAASHATLAVLLPENQTGQRQIDEWPSLIQSLLASELTGRPDLAVMDVLGLNDLLEQARSDGRDARRALDTLRRAGVSLALDAEVLSAEAGYQIQARVVDTETGESRFAARADVAKEEALPAAAMDLATQVLTFYQVQVLQLSDRDLRPWISYREQNIEAVKAFVIGNQYVYRRQSAESERYMRRAIELDPSFIAPKLWLIPRLLRKGSEQEAQAVFDSLLALESKASPFEQALIGYVGARLKGDTPAMMRALETAMTYSPGNNILLVTWAYLRLEAGDCVSALTAMRPAVEIGWRYPPLYPVWTFCAAETGRRDDVGAGIDRFLQLSGASDAPEVYGLLEASALAVGDAPRAATCRQIYDARKRDAGITVTSKDLVAVYTRLGAYCLRSQAYARAATMFERAIAAERNVAPHHDNLGTALEALGEAEKARKEYERAVSIDGGSAHARARLRALAAGAPPERR